MKEWGGASARCEEGGPGPSPGNLHEPQTFPTSSLPLHDLMSAVCLKTNQLRTKPSSFKIDRKVCSMGTWHSTALVSTFVFEMFKNKQWEGVFICFLYYSHRQVIYKEYRLI
jgi:hypothetical protein